MFWESLSLWATLCLNLDIVSLVSNLCPELTAGGGGGVKGADGFGASVLGAGLGASTGLVASTGLGVSTGFGA